MGRVERVNKPNGVSMEMSSRYKHNKQHATKSNYSKVSKGLVIENLEAALKIACGIMEDTRK